MRFLAITPESRAEIDRLVAYSRAHPIPEDVVRRFAADPTLGPVCGGPDRDQRMCEIPDGYICAFSVEWQPAGWCRHLSVSLRDPSEPSRVLHPTAAEALCRLFGFENGAMGAKVWVEDLPEGRKAVNFVHPIGVGFSPEGN